MNNEKTSNGERIPCLINGVRVTGKLYAESRNWTPSWHLTLKLTPDGLDINVNPKSITTLEDNIENTILDIGPGKDFMKKMPKQLQQKPKLRNGT